ncbi:DnaT-like ssDNA-binding domain-containing protein [Buchnera aphidicola (Chaitoregma tattakana)]|uniref:DnaT-like ssDNA-binding domain-containing protein n=1 Tax=Buchnera aphidicola TaxID=9 RepID=UPI0031B881A9
MNIKNMNTLNITIENFLKNPFKFLKQSKKKIILILKNDIPVTCITNFKFIKKNFEKLKKYEKKKRYDKFSKIISTEQLNNNYNTTNKFAMHDNWHPDKNFIQKASIWGIKIKNNVSKSELKSFIDYWKAERRFLYHIQWQQKLAYSLKITRSSKHKMFQEEPNKIYKKNNFVPDGFRDK